MSTGAAGVETLPVCQTTVNTSLGEIIIVDEPVSHYDTQDYCFEKSAILAPINSPALITEISALLHNCTESGRLVARNEAAYSVGLNTFRGVGQWSNGEDYEPLVTVFFVCVCVFS